MNFRRLSRAFAAVLLAAGIVTAGVAPAATAAPKGTSSSTSTQDTGWGFK